MTTRTITECNACGDQTREPRTGPFEPWKRGSWAFIVMNGIAYDVCPACAEGVMYQLQPAPLCVQCQKLEDSHEPGSHRFEPDVR